MSQGSLGIVGVKVAKRRCIQQASFSKMNHDESNRIATLGHKMNLHSVFELYPGFLMGSKVNIKCSSFSLMAVVVELHNGPRVSHVSLVSYHSLPHCNEFCNHVASCCVCVLMCLYRCVTWEMCGNLCYCVQRLSIKLRHVLHLKTTIKSHYGKVSVVACKRLHRRPVRAVLEIKRHRSAKDSEGHYS